MFLATKNFQTQQRRAVNPVFVTNLWDAAASDGEVVLSQSSHRHCEWFYLAEQRQGAEPFSLYFLPNGIFIYLLLYIYFISVCCSIAIQS